ncbi:MAG: alkyl sulfatase dimerization domain-containing protein [Dehalococcoidia bacterium]
MSDNIPRTPGTGGHPDFSLGARVPEEIGPGVYATGGFGNSGWVITDEGVVVIDTGLGPGPGKQIRDAIATTSDRPIAAVIYTHGHHDHVLGTPSFVEGGTRVIAHDNVAGRFDRYKLTRDYINLINGIQFGFDLTGRTYEYVYPTEPYARDYRLELSGRAIEVFHGKGETDDASIVHVPDCGAVFAGDFLIGSFPNIGNPYKVIRYEREWFEALERVRALNPQAIMPGHGQIWRAGREMDQMLDDTIAVMRFLHVETVRQINAGASVEEAVERIRLPENLEQSPYLAQTYSRVEFAVTNIYRRYCGWFDFNPAHLLRVPRREMAAGVADLRRDDQKIIQRARELHEDRLHQQALELLDLILLRHEDDREGRELRASILEALANSDRCLMSRDAYLHYLQKDRELLAAQT